MHWGVAMSEYDLTFNDEQEDAAPQVVNTNRPKPASRASVESSIAGASPDDTGTSLNNQPVDLRSVLDGMSEGFSLLDADFTILDVNSEALRLETRTREQLVGHSHWEMYPGTEQSPLGQAYKRALRERVPVTLEHQYLWEDGRISWLDMRAYPTADGRLAVFFRDVTDRHLADTKLRESEERFRGAVEAFADILWTNDAKGCMIGEQPGWAALTGQAFDDYQGYGWSDAVHPDDAQPTIDAWEAAVAEHRLFAFEHRVRRHDGVWRRFSIRAVPVLNDDGSIREWVGVHHDITDLRENETRFRQFADNINAMFYVHEVDEERISYVNAEFERIWQQPASAIYADMQSALRDIHADDLPTVESALQRQRAGESTDTRYRLVRRDGTVCHIHDRSFATVDPDSGARRFVGIAEDVTVTTEARLHLSRNAATFEKLVQSSPFGVCVVDSEFRLVEVSQGAKTLLAGIDPLIGRDTADILRILWQEPFATEAIRHFRYALDTGESYVSLKTIEARGNVDETQAYDWQVDQIVLPDGRFGVVCYFYDLSERMALEASLQQALIDKDMLLREIDHRVRNSMSMVAALLSIQGGASENVEVKQALSVAASRMQAIARVHERLYKGDQLGMVEFGSYLEEICRDLRASLQRDGISLALKTVPIDLPVDQAVPLGLVTNELVTNAFKHCGNGAAIISVELACDADCLTLTVSDTGVGMANDYNAEGRKGLGMQVITLLTRQLGGSLTLPEAGGSAAFSVTVPVLPEYSQ